MTNKVGFEFDTIYVIESLNEDERHTGQMLYDDIIRWISHKHPYIKCTLLKIESKRQLITELKNIQMLSYQRNVYPLLHFEMHGSPEGLSLNSGELITWKNLAEELRIINIVIKNNLFVSLASCHGAHILKELSPTMPAPFFAFIGPWQEVFENDILISFTSFFECIYSTEDSAPIDIASAMRKLNTKNVSPHRFSMYHSESFLKRIFDDCDKHLTDEVHRSKRIDQLVERTEQSIGKMPSEAIPHFRATIEQLLFDKNEELKNQMRDIFLCKESALRL